MLTWAGAGWAEAKQITPVAIVRILSVRMVVAFELRPNLTGVPVATTFLTLRAFLSARPNNQGPTITPCDGERLLALGCIVRVLVM
jgi:hypothetical protein